MSTIQHIESEQNSANPPVKNQTLKTINTDKRFLVLGIVIGFLLITSIVLVLIFVLRKNNKSQKIYKIPYEENDDFDQSIELIVDGKDEEKRRNLQEENKVQILGKNFNELNKTNAAIYLDNKKVPFDKYISIKSSSSVKIVIKFSVKFFTFKEMFSGCKKVKEISFINVESKFVLETTSMFENCINLGKVHFQNTTFNNINSTANMFLNCTNLKTIEMEGFSTNETKDFSKMFKNCSSLSDSTFIESLSTKKSENFNEMFSGCSLIKSLNLSGFDTSNAKNMSGMFKGMSNLEKLELKSFHTEKVEDMSEMFESCKYISFLNLSNFNTKNVISMERMFTNCFNLTELNLTSFNLTSCNSTLYMFSNTTRELMLSIEKNEKLMIIAGESWSEKTDENSNITKKPLDMLFLVDATGSMGPQIEKVKNEIIYIAVNLLKKKGMEIYDLSLGALFYRDPIDSPIDIHESFDFEKNALNFKNFVSKIEAKGGNDLPEDWAGAFNSAKNLSWGKNSTKFIVHIADAPAHGEDWNDLYYGKYSIEGNKTDEIITYYSRNNFSIAGLVISKSAEKSFLRAKEIFKNNGNKNYFINYFYSYTKDEDYFLNIVYDSFKNISYKR